MSSKRGRLLALLIGTVAAACVFIAVEGAFYIANRLRPEPDVEMIAPEFEPNSTSRAAYFVDGQAVYDVTYRLDENKVRVSPANPTDGVERQIYFFGGSFTFGQGVADAETLPNYVAAEWPGTMVHNLASPGMGTLHVYERIDLIREYVDQDSGTEEIGVYVLIPSHVNRNIGSMRLVSTWAADFPYYEFDDDGDLEKRGTFKRGRPFLTAFQELVSHEQILKFMRTDIPAEPKDDHLDFTVHVIVECERKFREVTGSEHFYVVLYPNHPYFEFKQDLFIPFLLRYKIDYLDYREAVDLTQPDALIKVDGHPSASSNRQLAPFLVRDLQKKLGQ